MRAIGRRALRAKIGRGAVIIGEGAAFRPRAIIVRIADGIGQPISMAMPMVVPARLGGAGGCGQYGQGGSSEGELG